MIARRAVTYEAILAVEGMAARRRQQGPIPNLERWFVAARHGGLYAQPMAADTAHAGGPAGAHGGGDSAPVVIKKYANRRLYNTATSSYVTLDDLSKMVKDGGEFVVYDAKTGEDITRPVLTQIIVEEEQKVGQNLLPTSFLRQLIGLYGDSMQWLVPRYLEHVMAAFGRNQEQMRKSLQDAFGGMFPFGQIEEMGKQNMALFEQTMKMFTPPFAGGTGAGQGQGAGEKPPEKDKDAAMADLKERINALQRQIEQISKPKG